VFLFLNNAKTLCVTIFCTLLFFGIGSSISRVLGLLKPSYLGLGFLTATAAFLFLCALLYTLIQNLYPEGEGKDPISPKLKAMICGEIILTGFVFVGIVVAPFILLLFATKLPMFYFEAYLYSLVAIGIGAGTFRILRRTETKRIGINLPLDDISSDKPL